MSALVSKDGTRIAYDRFGHGHPVILVLGALDDRSVGAPLAHYLSHHFRVYNYDRRGRGQSGDADEYAIGRELDDLEVLMHRAGRTAAVFGYASGAILALRAAKRGVPIDHLALYEPSPTGGDAPRLAPALVRLLEAGKRLAAVELFQKQALGLGEDAIARSRQGSVRADLERIAPTLVYDSVLRESLPRDLLPSIHIPTLVIDGDQSIPAFRQAARAIANGIPDASYVTLRGQGREIAVDALGPVLEQFFRRHFIGTKPGPESGPWPFGRLLHGHMFGPHSG